MYAEADARALTFTTCLLPLFGFDKRCMGSCSFLQPDQSFCWRGGGLHGRVPIEGPAPDSYCAGNSVARRSVVWIFAESLSLDVLSELTFIITWSAGIKRLSPRDSR